MGDIRRTNYLDWSKWFSLVLAKCHLSTALGKLSFVLISFHVGLIEELS